MNSVRLLNSLKVIIDKLPKGYISKKIIKGKDRYYLQWNDNGKKFTKYIKYDELDDYKKKLELRKEIEKRFDDDLDFIKLDSFQYDFLKQCHMNILIGSRLNNLIMETNNMITRHIYDQVNDFIYDQSNHKLLILYGLRRTGKTTLIEQCILNMSFDDFKKTAFIKCQTEDDLDDLNHDLKILIENGYKYIFIDEVTFLEYFIEGASLLSDLYSASGIKIILSGTDSLGFYFTKNNQLYNRAVFVHTTFIPYCEYENVLGIIGIDKYIEYGGTMAPEDTFIGISPTNDYIDTAISHNIQHSLKYYDNEGHFRHLKELYDNQELTNVINRIVENMNHEFTIKVIVDDFISHDFGISKRNLSVDTNNPSRVLYEVDRNEITLRLKEWLNILNKNEQKVQITQSHMIEIKEYLKALDLIKDIEVISINDPSSLYRTVFTQPGMRYCQAKELVKSLGSNDYFKNLDLDAQDIVKDRILTEIKGRMIEDIVLLETSIARTNQRVFKLKFDEGEFDMVIFDPEKKGCQIFEIKHSNKINENQYKNLIDKDKLEKVNYRFGKIFNKCVIYRGETQTFNDIEYINIEQYLRSLY